MLRGINARQYRQIGHKMAVDPSLKYCPLQRKRQIDSPSSPSLRPLQRLPETEQVATGPTVPDSYPNQDISQLPAAEQPVLSSQLDLPPSPRIEFGTMAKFFGDRITNRYLADAETETVPIDEPSSQATANESEPVAGNLAGKISWVNHFRLLDSLLTMMA